MSRRSLAAAVVVLGFVGILVYGTLGSQQVECRVTVEFDGGRNSAAASAETKDEALRQAVTTACGPLAPGMDNSIRCGNTPPVEQDCRTL
jgi:uncharacterized protein (UPF0333 family)